MSKPTLEVIQVDPCRAESLLPLKVLGCLNLGILIGLLAAVASIKDCRCEKQCNIRCVEIQQLQGAVCDLQCRVKGCENQHHTIEVKGSVEAKGTIIVAGDVDVSGKVEGLVPVIVFHDEKSSVGSLPAPEPKKPELKKESPPRSAGCK